MKLKSMSIEKKLTGSVLFLLILVSAGVGIASYVNAYRAVESQLKETIPQMAKYGAMLIRSKLDNYLAVMQGIAARNVIRSMDWEKQRPALEFETNRMRFMGMGIITRDGQARYPDGSVAALGDRAYFKQAMEGEPAFSDVIISRVTNSPVMVVAVPIKDDQDRPEAVLIARLDGAWLSETTDRIKYGEKGYSYVIDGKGALIAHGNRDFVLKQRNFIEEAKTNLEYAPLAAMFQHMIRGESGFDEYPFMGSNRFFGYSPIEGTAWSIAVGAHSTDVFQQVAALRLNIVFISLVFVVIGIILTIFLARGIIRPIRWTVDTLKALSEGDLTRRLKVDSRDEIGEMADGFNRFVDKLQSIISSIADGAHTLASSATELSVVSAQTAQSLETMSNRTSTVAAAAEESSVNAHSVAAGMEQTTMSLASVASATEEMSVTINEISASSEKALAISAEAGGQASSVSTVMKQLGQAAQEIDKVTETITDISSQTNLLALNATIEAARVGAAGKGFAVVANEIKDLAKKTAMATEDIKAKIGGVQTSAGCAIEDIRKITGVIADVGGIVSGIAAAIEQQAAVTREVASNIAQASAGVHEANTRVAQTASASRTMAEDIAGVNVSAGEIRFGGEHVQESAAELSRLAEQLRGLVGQFRVA